MVPFSVLDLAPILAGGDAADSFRRSADLARHAEALGFERFWLAEHHNMPGIASAATSVVIAHVAAATRTIRVGAGGIMLPNHSPLVIAEQFGTLAALFPGRIDLAVGRAPGTDQPTARALRRGRNDSVDTFPRDVVELQSYFAPVTAGQVVQAVPGAGLGVPIWVLGSSLFGAQLAADLGLPFAFASHFAPDHLDAALHLYRAGFQPSAALTRPHAMVAAQVVAADTDAAAARLFTSLQQSFTNLLRGQPGPLPPPVDSMDGFWSPPEEMHVNRAFREAIVGAPERVGAGIAAFLQRTRADELIVTSMIFDHDARRRSLEIIAQVRDELARASTTRSAQSSAN